MSGEKHKVDVVEIPKQRFSFRQKTNNLKTNKKFRKIFVFVVILALIILASLIARTKYSELTYKKNSICNGKENNTFYKEVSSNLNSYRVAELGKQVNKIKRTKYYQSDVNCLYVAFYYYKQVNNTEELSKHFKLIEEKYNSKKGFVKALSGNVTSLESVKNEYTRYTNAQKEIMESIIYY